MNNKESAASSELFTIETRNRAASEGVVHVINHGDEWVATAFLNDELTDESQALFVRHLAASLNACRDTETDALESMPITLGVLASHAQDAIAHRTALFTALEKMLTHHVKGVSETADLYAVIACGVLQSVSGRLAGSGCDCVNCQPGASAQN